jgi:hypothetical protein
MPQFGSTHGTPSGKHSIAEIVLWTSRKNAAFEFFSGLVGTAEKQVRFSLPKTLDEDLKIAITVDQAELQERRSEAFYLRSQEHVSGTADLSTSQTSHRDSEKARTQYSIYERTEARTPADH